VPSWRGQGWQTFCIRHDSAAPGLAQARFIFEGQYARALDAVRADVSLGRLLNVRATPTFFINGVRCEDGGSPLAPRFLDLAIELELRKAGRLR
jgi:hypothetical protein